MRADDLFHELCPGMTVAEYCFDPTKVDICCGICPNAGVSGLSGHISLAFSSLCSITSIAMAPASAPNALFVNLLQCNAYALSLLWYLLGENNSGFSYFHAAYMLMLALAALIPLTAIACSPPWAITGDESPDDKARRLQNEMTSGIEEAIHMLKGKRRSRRHSSDDDDDAEERGAQRRLLKKIKKYPEIFIETDSSGGYSWQHLFLYFGFTASFLLWVACFYFGVYGGATGSLKAISQKNCTENWAGASFILYCDIALLVLSFFVFIGTVANPFVSDVASCIGREATCTISTNQKIVFGASFAVWVLWMVMSFAVYIDAGNSVLLVASEFSWGFGSTFSAIMVLVPVTSIVQALWKNR